MAESEKEKQELVRKILELDKMLSEEELMKSTVVQLEEYLEHLEKKEEGDDGNNRPMGCFN